ncbi:RDD family protein [Marinigracilibium pacificum]|uniref:RDD family protein n=1 Tax=Marinigracilibium pacificum TaxID=2729599 RepID=A0A848IW70_9BACT|nr:RDD family protein [Marinigracilibium pacificum]NMM47525.1 RDD family protein [Marinigracilibium pacificum]
MKNNQLPIVPISFILSILGLIGTLYPFFFPITSEDSSIFSGALYWFTPYAGVWISNMNIFLVSNPNGPGHLNLMSLVVFSLFILASILYTNSNGSRSNLLRICYSIILLTASFGLLYGVLNLIFFKSENTSAYNWGIIPHFIKNIIFTTLSYKIIKQLSVDKSENILSKADQMPVSRGMRFSHHIIDSLISFLYVAVTLHDILVYRLFYEYLSHLDEFAFNISVYFAFLFYYIFFESIFQATPGKFATGSRVISKGDKPGVWRVIGRTFTRLIPFDAISFLGEEGWHDKWSKTSVVKEGRVAEQDEKITFQGSGLIDA